MNLYRSFGNLMEAWVNEGGSYPDSPSDFRSESVDSGVETASTDAFPPRDGGRFPALSSPRSPAPSSSSSSPSPASSALRLKVEQALQRTDPRWRRDSSELLGAEEAAGRRRRASLQPQRSSAGSVGGRRSGSFGQTRTAYESASLRRTSDPRRRPAVLILQEPKSKELSEEEPAGLSPGLCYLEQVCQMLENIARQRLENRALRTEAEAPREPERVPESQEADGCGAAAEDVSSRRSLENLDDDKLGALESQRIKVKPLGHFRQRSASDTTLATLHLRPVHSDSRGQYLSKDELHERIEEDHVKVPKKGGSLNIDKHWRRILPSFRKEEGSVKDSKSQQQTPPSERHWARRRLSQMFRRRKTMPV